MARLRDNIICLQYHYKSNIDFLFVLLMENYFFVINRISVHVHIQTFVWYGLLFTRDVQLDF